MSKSPVKFGTDGWRGIIADDFTFENVRVAAAAIASYVLAKEDPKKGVFVGVSTRALDRLRLRLQWPKCSPARAFR